MRKDKKFFLLVEGFLAIMVLIVAILMIQESTEKESARISVIVKDSDSSRWDSFKYGLEMAAADYNVETFIVSTVDSLTAEEEAELLDSEMEQGADGLIVQPLSGEEMEEQLTQCGKKLPVMLVESSLAAEDASLSLPVTKPQHYEMGQTLVEELLHDYGGSLEGKRIGIVSSERDSEAVTERRKGVEDGVAESGGEIIWVVSGYGEASDGLTLSAYPGVDILVALDDRCLVLAGQAVVDGGLHGAVLYGIGNSTEAFYYLDNGYAECLVVPDEFNVGYQSLAELVKNMEYSPKKMESQTVSSTVIRKETLFSGKNENILFTMTQ